MNDFTKPIINPVFHDHPVVRLLEMVLEDARRGRVTSIAMVCVSPEGIIQHPAQGQQVRELCRGADSFMKCVALEYDRATRELGKYTQGESKSILIA